MTQDFSRTIFLDESFGWRKVHVDDWSLYFKGYLNGVSCVVQTARRVAKALFRASKGSFSEVQNLDGHFAAVLETPAVTILAVDRIRSTPLMWANSPCGGQIISDHAKPFMDALSLSIDGINYDAALDFALSGFVLGRDTLYKSVHGVLPGEIVVFNGAVRVTKRYAVYRPWLAEKREFDEVLLRSKLRDVTLNVLEKMIERVGGRQILLPLSAGLDSRLIASGLKHLGYRNVQCFSYGRAGNHEAAAAAKIAEALGYPWHFLPSSTRSMRRRRAQADFERYLTFTDSLTATPVEQDVFTIMNLHREPWAEHDAIIVNGQSGDFISGNHIPSILCSPLTENTTVRNEIVFSAIAAKHFDLWPDLRSSSNMSHVQKRLWKEFEEVGAPIDDPEASFALYEFSEFQNRQAKYVLGNQRSYEVFGWNWHLPLWDKDYIEFWERIPCQLKLQQKLYREMLIECNWGGVWRSLLPAPRWITPSIIRPVRNAVHLVCLPFGDKMWREVDRRFFNHVTDPLRKYSAVPYLRVMLGPPHRNAISWLTEIYLERHGLSRDGSRK